jgi:HSP20 family molecular chaperone IbpA
MPTFEQTFPLSAHEGDKEVTVELEVPRYRPEDIKVSADAATGSVTIEGQRGAQPPSGTGRTHTHVGVPHFKRQFTVSPRLYDLGKMTTTVDAGLLTISIPRKEVPKAIEPKATPVAVEGKGGEVATTKKEEGTVALPFQHIHHWPPKLQVVKGNKPGLAVTYRYDLPAGIPAGEVKVDMLDNGALRIDVNHKHRKESEHGFEEHTASFTRHLQLPEGTKPEDVVANYKDGHLSIDVHEAKK